MLNYDDRGRDFRALATDDAPAEVRAALTEYDRLRLALVEAGHALRDLQERRPAAEAADLEAGADAIIRGAKDPGTRNTDRLDREVADAQRLVNITALAQERAFRALSDALAANAAEWRVRVAEQRREVADDLSAALENVGEALRALDALDSRDAFLANPGVRKNVAGLLTPRPSQVVVNNTATHPATILAALRQYGAQETPADPSVVTITVSNREVRNRYGDEDVYGGEVA